MPISELIITNKLSIKKSFDFAREIVEQDLGFFMDSLDVESFFTNVPLKEAISISCASPISNEAEINTLSWNDFEKLLIIALKNNFFN